MAAHFLFLVALLPENRYTDGMRATRRLIETIRTITQKIRDNLVILAGPKDEDEP